MTRDELMAMKPGDELRHRDDNNELYVIVKLVPPYGEDPKYVGRATVAHKVTGKQEFIQHAQALPA